MRGDSVFELNTYNNPKRIAYDKTFYAEFFYYRLVGRPQWNLLWGENVRVGFFLTDRGVHSVFEEFRTILYRGFEKRLGLYDSYGLNVKLIVVKMRDGGFLSVAHFFCLDNLQTQLFSQFFQVRVFLHHF